MGDIISKFLDIFANVGACSILLYALTLPLVIFSIGKRFDPLFKYQVINFNGIVGGDLMMRSSWYAAVMVYYPWVKKPRPVEDAIFVNYNLWQHATKYQRTIACIHIILGMLGFLSMCVFGISQFVSYILRLFH